MLTLSEILVFNKMAPVKADSKDGLRQKDKYLESRPNSGVYVMGSQI